MANIFQIVIAVIALILCIIAWLILGIDLLNGFGKSFKIGK